MLFQELPPIESTALDRWERWLSPGIIAAAGLSIGLVFLLFGLPILAAVAAAVGAGAALVAAVRSPKRDMVHEQLSLGPDYGLVGSALGLSREAAALTNEEGSLLIANAAYRQRFGGARAPLDLASDQDGQQALAIARNMAWRDGAGCVAGVSTEALQRSTSRMPAS